MNDWENETIPWCDHCGRRDTVKLRRQIAANGIAKMTWHCTSCQTYAQRMRPYIPNDLVSYWIDTGRLKVDAIRDIPVCEDRRGTVQCEVCGEPYASRHHWMPRMFREIVPDHDNWPTSYLCRSCHKRWHDIVTFYMPGTGASELSKSAKELAGG